MRTSRLAVLLLTAALAGAGAGCSTDDAAERDAREGAEDVQREVEQAEPEGGKDGY
jgi:hypothetical protein